MENQLGPLAATAAIGGLDDPKERPPSPTRPESEIGAVGDYRRVLLASKKAADSYRQ